MLKGRRRRKKKKRKIINTGQMSGAWFWMPDVLTTTLFFRALKFLQLQSLSLEIDFFLPKNQNLQPWRQFYVFVFSTKKQNSRRQFGNVNSRSPSSNTQLHVCDHQTLVLIHKSPACPWTPLLTWSLPGAQLSTYRFSLSIIQPRARCRVRQDTSAFLQLQFQHHHGSLWLFELGQKQDRHLQMALANIFG